MLQPARHLPDAATHPFEQAPFGAVVHEGQPAVERAPALILPVRRLADDGLKAWQEVLERGYEGYVAKDPGSPYVAGRSLRWLKVKQREYRVKERGWDPAIKQ